MTRLVDLLDELEAKSKATTPLPWVIADGGYVRQEQTRSKVVSAENYDCDLDFIVSLVNAFPKLAERLRKAEEVCEEAEDIAHGLDETCGKFPALEKKLEAWRKAKTGEGERE